MKNSFGNIFRLTTFGESHGPAVGGIIDGMPSGIKVDMDEIQRQLDRRRPGQSSITTARNEKDRLRVMSGILDDGTTSGTPIAFMVENADQHSNDYGNMRDVLRPSHADYTYLKKYGRREHRGGGRSSARETLARVAGGAFARQAIAEQGIEIYAYTSQVGDITLDSDYTRYDAGMIENNVVRCPDPEKAEAMIRVIEEVKRQGDTIGGVVTCVVKGVPAGLGEPVFGRLQAMLASAMLSINAAKGFDYGMGFAGVGRRGSEMIDLFTPTGHGLDARFATNHSGGIQGGISNGADIYFRVAFKPVATLLREIPAMTSGGEPTTLHARGRHDPCVLPRAVPVVEAMAAMTILDAWLLNKTTRL